MKLDDIGGDWTPPQELGYSGLRPVRLSGQGIALAVLAVALSVGSVLLGSVLWKQSGQQEGDRRLLDQQAVLTQATVVDVFRKDTKGHPTYIRYRFTTTTGIYTKTLPAPESIWKGLKPGDTLNVRYVPTDPALSHPADWDVEVTPRFLALLVPIMMIGAMFLISYRIRRQWRLLSQGRPAPGVITSVRRQGKRIFVDYEFRKLDGATQQGRISTGPRNVPVLSSEVCVLYDPDDPRKSALYPLATVRPG